MFFFDRFTNRINYKETAERVKKEKPLALEKGDLTAIMIAAFLVIGTMMAVFTGTILLVYWLFIGRF